MSPGADDIVFAVEDPSAPDVVDLLGRHLAFARGVTPPGHVHALDVDGLRDDAVTFFTARRHGRLVGVAALRRLEDGHVEMKSMHVAAEARGTGVGRAMVAHLLEAAVERGYARISLETGSFSAFEPARALYASCGFTVCEPFGGYTANPHSTCMTRTLP